MYNIIFKIGKTPYDYSLLLGHEEDFKEATRPEAIEIAKKYVDDVSYCICIVFNIIIICVNNIIYI